MKLKKYIKIKPIHAILCAAIVLVTVVIDYVTKQLVVSNMELYDEIPLIPDVLQLKYIKNYGAAFGSFSDQRWVFMSLSCVMIIALIVLILIWDKPKPMFYVGMSMALGGGIGNMIDRIAYGYVIDFIDFCAFPKLWKWVFNGADSFVCIGAALLVIFYITDLISSARKAKNTETVSESNGNHSKNTDSAEKNASSDTDKKDTVKGEEA